MFGGKKRSSHNYSKNQDLVSEQLKLAYAKESQVNNSLRADIKRLEEELERERERYERSQESYQALLQERDTLQALVDSDDGQKDLYEKNASLKKDLADMKRSQQRVKKKLKEAKSQKKKLEEEKDGIITGLRERIDVLMHENNALAKEVRGTKKGPALKEQKFETLRDVAEACKRIYSKNLDDLACHKDLPRLARNFQVFDLNGNWLGGGKKDCSLNECIKLILVSVARNLEGNILADKIDDKFENYIVEGRDTIKGLYDLLKEIIGEQSLLVHVLKAANQSIIAPPVVYLNKQLENKLSFNSEKNGWSISVLKGDSVIMVAHKKKEKASPQSQQAFGEFSFEWVIDFVFDTNMSELKSMRVSLNSISIDEDAMSAKNAEKVRNLLNGAFDTLADIQKALENFNQPKLVVSSDFTEDMEKNSKDMKSRKGSKNSMTDSSSSSSLKGSRSSDRFV